MYDANGTTLLGVVGIDMNFSVIRESVLSLRIVEEDGYSYILTPTGDGVAVHPDLELDDVQNILELEDGVDEDEFSALVTRMTENCNGTASYQKNGGTWLLSWEHETISGSGTGDSTSDGGVLSGCSTGGFIIVVTVSEAALLGVREMGGCAIEFSLRTIWGTVCWCLCFLCRTGSYCHENEGVLRATRFLEGCGGD